MLKLEMSASQTVEFFTPGKPLVMPTNQIAYVAGALAGLGVRFYRYPMKGFQVFKTLMYGATSVSGTYYVLPDDLSTVSSFVVAYFSVQSIGYLKGIRRPTNNIKKP